MRTDGTMRVERARIETLRRCRTCSGGEKTAQTLELCKLKEKRHNVLTTTHTSTGGKVEYVEDSVDLSAPEVAEISNLANQVRAIVDQSGHSRNIYMQLGTIPIVDQENPTFALNWFLIASDIFGIQVPQSAKYEFLFGDEYRENPRKRLEKFKELFRATPLFAHR